MKKFLVLLMVSSILLTGCEGFKTPEELIAPPEISVEKKILKDTILEFVPSNVDLVAIPQIRGTKGADSVTGINLNDTEQEEIVSIYRSKSDRKLGLIVVAKIGELWAKAFELQLDATEVSDYELVDLDSDGIKEILLGYFRSSDSVKELCIIGLENGEIKKLFDTQYLALDINRISENKFVDIAISTRGNENNHKFRILNYKNKMIQVVGEMIYPENNEIYKILYGNMNLSQKAYFLDMYVDNETGRTDILSFENGAPYSIVRKNAIKELSQEIPIESRDINGDGIIDAIQNKVLESKDGIPNLVKSTSYLVDYNENLAADLDYFESYEDNIRVSIPHVEDGVVRAKKTASGITLSYYSNKLGRIIPFLEVNVVDSHMLEDFGQGYIQIEERYGKTIIAKKMDTDVLDGAEKNEFDRIMRSLQNFSDFIRSID